MKQPTRRLGRNLNRLWFAQSISLLGLQVGSIAMPLIALDQLDASPAQVALIATWASIPWLVLTPFIGVLADRVDRKRLLVVSHVARGLLWLTIPALYLTGHLSISQLWAVALLVGILGITFEIGYHAFLPQIVRRDQLARANGRMAATDAAARATGPTLAGYAVQLIGAPFTLLLQAMTSFLAAAATASIKPPSTGRASYRRSHTTSPGQPNERRPGLRQRLSSGRSAATLGFAYLWRIPPLRWLTLAEATYLFFFSACFAVIVVFLRADIGLTPLSVGIVFSVGSAAGIAGAATAAKLATRLGLNTAIRLAAILRGTGLAMLPLSLVLPPQTQLVALIAARALNAGAWSIYEVLANSYQQGVLDDSCRGSATAAGLWLARGAEFLGAAAVAAAAAAHVPTSLLILIAGIGATSGGILTLLVDTTTSPPANTDA